MSFYTVARGILQYPFKWVYRIKVTGGENEPETPYIACINHTSYSDPVVVAAALKKEVRFVARSSIIRFRIMRWLFNKIRVITINRGRVDTTALKECVSGLKNGDRVVIFPQGTRMPGVTPRPEQAEAGFALIASMAEVDVLPVSIITKNNHVRMFRRTHVIIGKPVKPEDYSNMPVGTKRKQVAEYLFKPVCDTVEGFEWK